MDYYITITIPRGVFARGKIMNKVNLRHLVGYDEQYLQEMPDNMLLNARVNGLLERIAEFEGASKEDIPNILLNLSIGDRVYLLLFTRQLLLGDTIQSAIVCPNCKQNMSLEFSVNSLLNIEYPEPSEFYRLNACGFNLQVRPITSSDQTQLLSLSISNEEEKLLEYLVRSCILHSDPPMPNLLPKSLIDEIGQKIGKIDPLSDITFAMSCPECKYDFSKPFPVEEFIFRELGMIGSTTMTISEEVSQLDHEVHLLAWNYHWSENDILSIPTRIRKKYVKLINTNSGIVLGTKERRETGEA